MKILLASDWYEPAVNGVVASVLNLRRGLIAQGHDVRILTLSGNRKSYKRDGVYFVGSVRADVVYPGARVRVRYARKPLMEIIDWKPDIIHTNSEFSTFLLARKIALKLNVPLVHTYHTVYEDYTHYFFPSRRIGNKIVRQFSRTIAGKTSAIIVPTEKVRKMLRGYGIATPIEVVPSGIDLERFAGSEAAREELRARYKIPEDHTVLVSVGRLAKEKNHEELFRFLKKCQGEKITFVLVGDGPYREELEQIVEQLDMKSQVIFTGMIPPSEVGSYYSVGDLFISASVSETQGLTYIEALSCGVPLLCRKDDCLKDVIVEGENGWTFTGEKDFARKLQSFIEDRDNWPEYREKARASSDKFSIPTFAKSVSKVYEGRIRCRY